MSVLLRIVLVIISLLTFAYVGRKIRKSQMQLEDALYWIIISGVITILSIFPDVAYYASNKIGFQAPVNFIFLVMIFLLLWKVFLLSIKISQLENKIISLTQEIALREKQIGEEHE